MAALQGEVVAATAATSPEVEAWLGGVVPGEQPATAASPVMAVLEAPGASPMELPVQAARARSTTEAPSMAQALALPQTQIPARAVARTPTRSRLVNALRRRSAERREAFGSHTSSSCPTAESMARDVRLETAPCLMPLDP